MRHAGLWRGYQRLKLEGRRLARLTYFVGDVVHTAFYMHWPPTSGDRRVISAALLFQYHKLEKGLVMPGPRRMFGEAPARAVMTWLDRWRAAGLPLDDPIYLGALETLQAYHAHLLRHQLDASGGTATAVSRFLASHPARMPGLETPQPLPAMPSAGPVADMFAALTLRRRSVRDFQSQPVPRAVIERAVSAAALSPSACNRQPCRVTVVSDPERRKQLLQHQNGNRGFGHLAPQILLITSDAQGFFDASERHQPYVDGGLFAMSLCLALAAEGAATCCLNWCVSPADDRAVHRLMGLNPSERIIMLMALGYAPDDGTVVPRSPRRALEEMLCFDDRGLSRAHLSSPALPRASEVQDLGQP